MTLPQVITILKTLGVEDFKETDSALILPTVCHNANKHEASSKLYFYKDNKFFYCYTECGGMSIFKFIEKFYETREISFDWYQDIYMLVENQVGRINNFVATPSYIPLAERYERKERNIILPEYNTTVLDSFIKMHPESWKQEGITEKSMFKYKIGLHPTQNKITIPHFDIDNRFIGLRGRTLDPEEAEKYGKYMPMKIEDRYYSHPLSLNLYGLNNTARDIENAKIVYLHESEKGCMLGDSFLDENPSAAVCGSNFNKFQLNILLKRLKPREVVLCFDSEEKPGEDKYFNKLYKICKKYNNYVNMSFIYDFNGELKAKEAPIDAGKDVFLSLLNKRIKVK